MPRWTRLTLCIGLLALLPTLTGCIKVRQLVTLMPDGSGKIRLQFGISDRLLEEVEEDEDPFEEVLPLAMKDKAQGIVAFTEPVREKKAGFSYLTYTVYFRDINQVRIEDLGEGDPAEYRYTRDGETATLTVTHGTVLSMIAEYDGPAPEDERAEIRQAMAGMEFSEHFALPGTFKDIDGVAAVDNTAKLDLTLDNMLDGTGPVEKLKGKDALRFEITDLQTDARAAAAFKQELDNAVTAWQAKQAEAAE